MSHLTAYTLWRHRTARWRTAYAVLTKSVISQFTDYASLNLTGTLTFKAFQIVAAGDAAKNAD